MPTQFYLPRADGNSATWLTAFSATAPAYAAKYGLTVAELTQLTDDERAFRQVLAARETFINFGQGLTGYKNALRDGLPQGQTVVVPTLPTLTLDAAALPGIFGRVAGLVNKIKNHPQYTPADGEAMGIEGAEAAGRSDDATLKPAISLRPASGGHPEVVWKKGDHSALEIEVDRNDTHGFVFLAIDTQPNYIDTAPLPAAGQSAKWTYRAIYRDKDERVGQWSAPESIPVAG